MKKDQIIQMARDAGLCNSTGGIEGDGGSYYDYSEEIERFAAAIRAATKEEDASICSDWSKDHAKHDGCNYVNCDYVAAAIDCADAIRASK